MFFYFTKKWLFYFHSTNLYRTFLQVPTVLLYYLVLIVVVLLLELFCPYIIIFLVINARRNCLEGGFYCRRFEVAAAKKILNIVFVPYSATKKGKTSEYIYICIHCAKYVCDHSFNAVPVGADFWGAKSYWCEYSLR